VRWDAIIFCFRTSVSGLSRHTKRFLSLPEKRLDFDPAFPAQWGTGKNFVKKRGCHYADYTNVIGKVTKFFPAGEGR
jgi:hypothetical protein